MSSVRVALGAGVGLASTVTSYGLGLVPPSLQPMFWVVHS